MSGEWLTIEATITDRHGATETVFAGSQPEWAWAVDRCAAWRKVARKMLLEARTYDPQGWRVTFQVAADA